MKHILKENNKIEIGKKLIAFPKETTINKIEYFRNVICFNTIPFEKDLDWSNIKTHQIWKERCLNNPSELFCYDFSGELKWKFPFDNVVGMGKIVPELKKELDFLTTEHYRKYIEKYKGKELLEVYVGDFRYVLDANTGEIYDKMASR
jgi:hypothetical protein